MIAAGFSFLSFYSCLKFFFFPPVHEEIIFSSTTV